MDAKQIIELGKSFEEAIKIKAEIQESKLEKAKLDKNIVILKKANAEEQAEYEQNKKEGQKQKIQLENNIKVLKVKRANLASSTVPEIDRLETLKTELNKTKVGLEKQENILTAKSETLRKKENSLEDKKDILGQIVELFKKL